MRKLLTILGSITLMTAIASSTVACGVQKDNKFVFRSDFSNIESNWKHMKKYANFYKNEFSDKNKTNLNNKIRVILASGFDNYEDVYNETEDVDFSGQLKIEQNGIMIPYTYSEKEDNTNKIYLDFFIKGKEYILPINSYNEIYTQITQPETINYNLNDLIKDSNYKKSLTKLTGKLKDIERTYLDAIENKIEVEDAINQMVTGGMVDNLFQNIVTPIIEQIKINNGEYNVEYIDYDDMITKKKQISSFWNILKEGYISDSKNYFRIRSEAINKIISNAESNAEDDKNTFDLGGGYSFTYNWY